MLRQSNSSDPWNCKALALLEYRRGNYSEAAVWARKALAHGGVPGGGVQARLLLAMAGYNLGQSDAAKEGLASARLEIDSVFGGDLSSGANSRYWHDWLAARILLHEAVALIEGGSKGLRNTAEPPPLEHAIK
jgi:hypothetical protein